jgi:hypothetical protein
MIRQETVNNRQVVDIKHFEPGVYLVRGKRNGRPVSGKFLKLH